MKKRHLLRQDTDRRYACGLLRYRTKEDKFTTTMLEVTCEKCVEREQTSEERKKKYTHEC